MSFIPAALIVCAGAGKRFGADKAVLKINGKPMFAVGARLFSGLPQISQVVLVLRKKHFPLARRLLGDKVTLVLGGKARRDSVYNGLKALGAEITHVLIHDGARPFVSRRTILKVLAGLKKHPAVICGTIATDTVKSVKNGFITRTLPREEIFLAQTPQGFKKDVILKAFAGQPGQPATDDARLVELLGKKVKIVIANRENIKITYPQDLKKRGVYG